ncbi:nucleotide disphospho-sugar-binding domain-containing protein [Brevibacillus parabrevis]|uniref:nucleotide disphospho-sugar-binding domain-containing protein n=1 Tax=Brevibacillus parabrevis TaxID=54914 RepID=UPI0012F4A8F3|nr:nucleotide disphospho-sugar-binding domain-containing protein [Brevibacillus parabrevis]
MDISRLRQAVGPNGEAVARNTLEFRRASEAEFQRLTASVQEKYGVQIHSPYEAFCNPAPLTIVYTSKEFQPFAEAIDHTYKIVGPSISPRYSQDGFDLAQIKEKHPIYISLGTIVNYSIDLYQLCFQASGHTEHSVVMSIGNKVQLAVLGDISGNFLVKSYVPQFDVLQHANLFITHGGMYSVSEGLYYGVPFVVLPQGADQPVIAGQVAKLGAGIVLDMQTLSASELREAAEQVLQQPSFRKAAATVSESFQRAGGYRQAVDEILA